MPGPLDRPAGPPAPSRPPHRLQLVGTDGVVATRRAISVLYVEDDEEDVFLVRRQIAVLPSFAVDFAHAPSLEAARAMLERHRFDVVLCDFWLGSETTIPLIDELKLGPAPAPVVLVSSLENEDIELIGRRAGAAGFVAKADLSAAALDRIFATLLPAEDPDAAARAPQGGVAGWLRALMRSLDAAKSVVGRPAQGGEGGRAQALLADLAESDALREDIIETLAGLERATRLGALAVTRFDAVPYLADAVRRLAETGGRGTVSFLPPAMPIMIEASPALFGDLVQGFFAEAADALARGISISVAPAIRDGRIVLEVTGVGPAGPAAPADHGVEAARAAAAADARRLLVETLARTLGGAVRFGPAAGDETGPVLVGILEVPLRPGR